MCLDCVPQATRPKNEVMRWDSESRRFIGVLLRLHKVLLCRTELMKAARVVKSVCVGTTAEQGV